MYLPNESVGLDLTSLSKPKVFECSKKRVLDNSSLPPLRTLVVRQY